jgi:hypothetical protein
MRMLEKEKLRGSSELKTAAFSNMGSLMILHLDYVQITGTYENFPEELRWLRMCGFPLKSIPSELPMKNLVALDMSYSKIEYFDMSCSNIGSLDISCRSLQRPEKRQKVRNLNDLFQLLLFIHVVLLQFTNYYTHFNS